MKLKGFLTSAAAMAIIASTSSANAADIAKHKPHHVKQMAIAAVAPTAPVFNWAGPYIGIEAGTAFSHFYSTDKTNTADGLKAELGKPENAALAGVFAGYNFRLGQHAILGIDGNVDFHNSQALTIIPGYDIDDTTTPDSYELYSEKALAAARIRLGYAQGRLMPYIAGGFSALRASRTTGPTPNGIKSSNKLLNNYIGWNIGAGIDYAISPKLFLRADYRFAKTKIKYFYTLNGSNSWTKHDNNIGLKSHLVRIGAAYKF